MLRHLRVTNFAILSDVTIELGHGMNVLTGETGAGKSLIVEAVNLLRGGRASADIPRAGADEAVVEAIVEVPTDLRARVASVLDGCGLPTNEEDEHAVFIRRVIQRGGRSRTYVNGALTTAARLAELGALLIDLSGQHQHQGLIDPARHLELIDAFARTAHAPDAALVTTMSAAWAELRHCDDELAALGGDERERDARIDYLRYQLEELEGANLQPGEDITIEHERSRLASVDQLQSAAGKAEQLLYSDDDSARDRVALAVRELERALRMDPSLEPLVRQCTEIEALIDDAADQLRTYADKLEGDPERLAYLDERLALIRRLVRKHAVGMPGAATSASRSASARASVSAPSPTSATPRHAGAHGNTPADAPRNSPANAPRNSPANAPRNALADARGNTRADAPGHTLADARSHASGDTRADARSDALGGTRVDARSDVPGDTRVDARSDVPGDTRADAPSDASGATRADARSDASGDTRAEARADTYAAADADVPPSPLQLVLAKAAELRAELDALTGRDDLLAELGARRAQCEAAALAAAAALTQSRTRAARKLEKDVTVALADLGMSSAQLSITIEPRALGPTGADRVELMLASNKGEDARPLAKIASGGELSRIMLALKLCLRRADEVATYVFDEVDTGIGGATAQVVATQIRAVASPLGPHDPLGRQVLCVTHLPQIAAYADHHFHVEKTEIVGRTETHVRKLTAAARKDELARMLGGHATATARAHAAELLAEAAESAAAAMTAATATTNTAPTTTTATTATIATPAIAAIATATIPTAATTARSAIAATTAETATATRAAPSAMAATTTRAAAAATVTRPATITPAPTPAPATRSAKSAIATRAATTATATRAVTPVTAKPATARPPAVAAAIADDDRVANGAAMPSTKMARTGESTTNPTRSASGRKPKPAPTSKTTSKTSTPTPATTRSASRSNAKSSTARA